MIHWNDNQGARSEHRLFSICLMRPTWSRRLRQRICDRNWELRIVNRESKELWIGNWKWGYRVSCRYLDAMQIQWYVRFHMLAVVLVLGRRRGKAGPQRKLNCSKGEIRISDFWLLMPSNLHYFGIYWQNVLYVLFQYARHYMKYLWVHRNVKFNGKSKGFLGLSHALIMHNDPKIDDP